MAAVTAGLESQLETELGSQSAVADTQALATGTATSVTLTLEFDSASSKFLALSTGDPKCEASCAVRAMVVKEVVLKQVQQATLFGDTSEIEVLTSPTCDCSVFVSQRDSSEGAGDC